MRANDRSARAAFERLAAEHPEDPLAAFYCRRLAAGESGVTIVLEAK